MQGRIWWAEFFIDLAYALDVYRDDIDAGYQRSMYAYDRLFLAVNR